MCVWAEGPSVSSNILERTKHVRWMHNTVYCVCSACVRQGPITKAVEH